MRELKFKARYRLFDFSVDPRGAVTKFARKVVADSGKTCLVGEKRDLLFWGCAKNECVKSFENFFEPEEEIPLW